MLYIYLGDKLTDPDLIGVKCTAVLNNKGKCIRSRLSTMLVDFGSEKHVLLARRLRKIKCPYCNYDKISELVTLYACLGCHGTFLIDQIKK